MAGKRNRLMLFRDLVTDRVFRVGPSSAPLIDVNVDTGALAMKGESLQVTQSPPSAHSQACMSWRRKSSFLGRRPIPQFKFQTEPLFSTVPCV